MIPSAKWKRLVFLARIHLHKFDFVMFWASAFISFDDCRVCACMCIFLNVLFSLSLESVEVGVFVSRFFEVELAKHAVVLRFHRTAFIFLLYSSTFRLHISLPNSSALSGFFSCGNALAF